MLHGLNQPKPPKGKAQTQRYHGKVNIDTWDPKGVALVLMTGSASGPEEEIAGLNYSAAEFAEVQRVATANGETLAEFLNSAIAEKLVAPARTVFELDQAMDQAEALAVLFQEQLIAGSDGDWNENIKAGLVALSAATFDRLRAEVERAGNQAHQGKGGAR